MRAIESEICSGGITTLLQHQRPAHPRGSLLRRGASAAFDTVTAVSRLLPARAGRVKWADRTLPRSAEKTFPALGFPRTSDSICPDCSREIPAFIFERDGMVMMSKTCPEHGRCEDIIYRDPALLRRIESLYPGDDLPLEDLALYQHGSYGVRKSHAAVYNFDITNRCDMHCTVCFASAWDAGVVYEPALAEIEKMLTDAANVRPKRQASVQFTGGEPTASPNLLHAIRFAKGLGFFKCQIATNGIRMAQDPGYTQALREAGLDYIYLQFDGTRNEDYAYTRDVRNMFDVKVRCIENCRSAGIDVVLVPTLVNGVNNHRVGEIVAFAIENIDVVITVSFQPVAITGRIEAEKRLAQRYTLSDLAHDVREQTPHGIEPMRDWYPLSATGPITDLIDRVNGTTAEWGSLACGCHPNCGIGTMLLVHETTKQVVPVPRLVDVDGVLHDLVTINDSHGGKAIKATQAALAMVRNYRAHEAPDGLGFWQLLKNFDSHTGRKLGFSKRRRHEWRMLLVAGMHFQDKYVYQFDRTQRCIIQYVTPEGNISFCAYNTGADYREAIEQKYRRGTNAEWFRENGRTKIYAHMDDVPLDASSAEPAPELAIVASRCGSKEDRHATAAATSGGCGSGCGCHTPPEPVAAT